MLGPACPHDGEYLGVDGDLHLVGYLRAQVVVRNLEHDLNALHFSIGV